MIDISGDPRSFIGMTKEDQLKVVIDNLSVDIGYNAATAIYHDEIDQSDRDAVKAEVVKQLKDLRPILLFIKTKEQNWSFHLDEEQEESVINKAVNFIHGDTPIQQVIDFLEEL